ncbi:SEC-C metal-binding domain-containing protein [Desnuesiella massiliensis]|uniref:SEC-C metal-binding domain-containing protein n=1 Tax=Desnuesiella massiliensis TaxID=1650662 RepID=UPI0006E1A4F1|nr:SEC-C metal-binding domain-containing protein [Desnuesiella massiliensis]
MLSQDKIKSLIHHSNFDLCKYALEYFSESFSKDEEVLGLALEVIEKLNSFDERKVLIYLSNLYINEENFITILNKLSRKNSNYDLYEKILINAEISLLEKYEKQLNTAIKLMKNSFKQRIIVHNKTTNELLEELKKFSEKNNNKYINEFDFKYGKNIAYELSMRKDIPIDKLLKDFKQNGVEDEYDGYYEGYLAYLFGELKEEKAISLLIPKLGSEGDLINEEAMKGLGKIGSDKVVEEIYQNFKNNTWEYKLFASGVLTIIKTEYSEKINEELFMQEEDLSIKTELAANLCKLFSKQAIEPIKEMILKEGYDEDNRDLREDLIYNAIANNVEFEEMSSWLKDLEKEKSRTNNIFKSTLPIANQNKIGRNETCPCGSGKKYKKCCGTSEK